MKPIKLRLQAFGPFKDLVEIDFDSFSSTGLFLLTGKTGAGKTTIFDAISYALFECTSGNARSKDNVRSDYASNDVKTFVEFSFMHNGICYSIYRQPSYLRDGYKSKTVSDASISYKDVLVTGSSNVNNEVKSVLGIDAKQFKQIAMIAQGEFQSLLFASSNDRTNIFRNIFDTSIYSKVSENLKNKFLTINRSYKDKKLLIDNEILNIDWDLNLTDPKEVINELELFIKTDEKEQLKIDKNHELYTEKINGLNSLLNTSIRDNEDILSLESKQKSFNEISVFYEENVDLRKEIEKQRVFIPMFESKLKLENQSVLLREEKDKEKKLLDKYISSLELIMDDYNSVDSMNKELEGISKVLDVIKNNKEIDNKINNIVLVKPKSVNKELFDSLEKKIINNNISVLYEKESMKVLEDKKLKDKLTSELKEVEDKEKELESVIDHFNEVYKDYDKLLNEINYMELVLVNNQAVHLASKLEPNKPCMVCGSTSHPNIASSTKDFDIDLLNSKKKDLEKIIILKDCLSNDKFALDALISKYNKVEILDGLKVLDEKKYRLDELKVLFDEYKNNVKDYDLLKVDIRNYEKSNIEYNTNLATIKTLEASKLLVDINYTIDDYNCLDKRIKDIVSSYNNINLEISRLSTSIEGIEKNLNNNTLELGDITNSIKGKTVWSRDELNKNITSVDLFFDSYSRLDTTIKDLEVRTKDKFIVDVSLIEADISRFKVLLDNLDKSVIIRLSNNKKVYTRLSSLYKESENLEKQYSMFKMLSDTANGNLNGKSKINFEQFVQAYYFDEVIRNSNLRLYEITDGRYELIKKESSNLELNVMDFYTGKVRDVKTLSGGEVFKSSLALALGMSDTIGAFAGGIKIDTLFIDEGFGSLDSDSLDSAINTLVDISQDKLIGIISHVDELKARIDKKIVVSQSSEGSKIDIMV